MLVKRINFSSFVEEFEKYNREYHFSYEGKKALFKYLSQLSEDIGEPIEIDIIGLCCEFSEYDCLEDFIADYGYSIGDIDCIEDIYKYTIVIPIDGESFIIQDF